MAGTAVSSLQIDCGEMPLGLRRRRLQAHYAEKIKNNQNHPTTSILEDCWQNYQKYKPGTEPFSVKVNGVLDMAGDSSIAAITHTNTHTQPWRILPPVVDISLSKSYLKRRTILMV